MGLASALTTSLTGLTAAETQIDVIGNNLANSQTVGFKSSEAIFATQFLQTQSLGSAPTDDTGGTCPVTAKLNGFSSVSLFANDTSPVKVPPASASIRTSRHRPSC